jgi:hypothetical protein
MSAAGMTTARADWVVEACTLILMAIGDFDQ